MTEYNKVITTVNSVTQDYSFIPDQNSVIVIDTSENRIGINTFNPLFSIDVSNGTIRTQDLIVLGNFSSSTNSVTFDSDIVPQQSQTYDLGSNLPLNLQWRDLYLSRRFYLNNIDFISIAGFGNDVIAINNTNSFIDISDLDYLNIRSDVLMQGNIGIGTTNPLVSIDINRTDAIRLPVGNNSQRPTGINGYIRYNSELNTFEGFGSGVWGTIGGVNDVNKDTFIRAESTPNANNDELEFFTQNIRRMIIHSNGNIDISSNLFKIYTNKIDISSNFFDISSHLFKIYTNNTDISNNNMFLSSSLLNINTNNTDISSNNIYILNDNFDISSNNIDISSNFFKINTNNIDISSNILNISNNGFFFNKNYLTNSASTNFLYYNNITGEVSFESTASTSLSGNLNMNNFNILNINNLYGFSNNDIIISSNLNFGNSKNINLLNTLNTNYISGFTLNGSINANSKSISSLNNLSTSSITLNGSDLNNLLNNKLPLSGGTLSGSINMNNNYISGVNNISTSSINTSSITLNGYDLNNRFNNYLPLSGGTLTGTLSMNNNPINQLNNLFFNSNVLNNTNNLYDILIWLSNRISNLENRATSIESRAGNLESRATSLESRATNIENNTVYKNVDYKICNIQNSVYCSLKSQNPIGGNSFDTQNTEIIKNTTTSSLNIWQIIT